jgi:hypothetical protein
MKKKLFLTTVVTILFVAFGLNSQSVHSTEDYSQTGTAERVKITREQMKDTNNSTKMEYWEPMRLGIRIKNISTKEPLSLVLTPSNPQTIITKDFEHFCYYEYFKEGNNPIQTIDFDNCANISGLHREIDMKNTIGDDWWSFYHLYVYSDSDSFEKPAYFTLEIKDDWGHHHYLKTYPFCELRKQMKYFNAAPANRTAYILLAQTKEDASLTKH